MKAILASKMYRSSKNKSKIRAAMEDPINAELVQQLREYLDPEYLTTEYFEGSNDNVDVDDGTNAADVAEVDPDVEGGSSADGTFTSDDDSSTLTDGDIGNAVDEDAEPSEEVIDVAEATRITASSQVCCCEVDVEVIKGTMNSRQDTAGATRVACKDNELWIYYNDKINLNNVMGPVIDILNATGYTYLEFNRLARTDNAIVFEIADFNTNSVQPIAEGTSDE